MGIQARDRQDELFDLRHQRRLLLCALTLSLCGDQQDRAKAKVTLMDFAQDPVLAKYIVIWSESLPKRPTSEDSKSEGYMPEDFNEVLKVAQSAAHPSNTRVPAIVHQRA